MGRLRSRKVCAALVLIAWTVTLIALWGMQDASRRATAPFKGVCAPKDLQGLGIQLEMAASAESAKDLLTDPAKGDCLRRGMAAQVRADYLFIPAYSLLTLALFLFVRAFWIEPPRDKKSAGWILLILGIVLAAAMATADVIENLHFARLIDLAAQRQTLRGPDFDRLALAGRIKWGSLAAASLVLGLTWTATRFRGLAWIPRLLALAAAGVFIAGLAMSKWWLVNAGVGVLAAFWTTAMIHAVAVAVEPATGGTSQS